MATNVFINYSDVNDVKGEFDLRFRNKAPRKPVVCLSVCSGGKV